MDVFNVHNELQLVIKEFYSLGFSLSPIREGATPWTIEREQGEKSKPIAVRLAVHEGRLENFSKIHILRLWPSSREPELVGMGIRHQDLNFSLCFNV